MVVTDHRKVPKSIKSRKMKQFSPKGPDGSLNEKQNVMRNQSGLNIIICLNTLTASNPVSLLKFFTSITHPIPRRVSGMLNITYLTSNP